MKRMRIFVLLFSGLFLTIGCQDSAPPTEPAAQTEETVSMAKYFAGNNWERDHDRLVEKFVTAVNTKDLDSFMECWWNDPQAVLVLEIGWVIRGWDNIKAGMQQAMSANETFHLEVNYVNRFRVGKNIYAVGVATWSRDDGTFQEVWTDVATLVDGKLVYVMDHAHDLRPFPPQPNFP